LVLELVCVRLLHLLELLLVQTPHFALRTRLLLQVVRQLLPRSLKPHNVADQRTEKLAPLTPRSRGSLPNWRVMVRGVTFAEETRATFWLGDFPLTSPISHLSFFSLLSQ
jgi:hypothetical protein